MPESINKRESYPSPHDYWLDKAAAENQLIVCRCRTCGRLVRYLAADLLPILGPAHRVREDAPFPCRCGERYYFEVRLMVPSPGDYGHLTVRRPAGIRQTQTWRTVKLGDELRNELHPLPDRTAWFVPAGIRPRRAR